MQELYNRLPEKNRHLYAGVEASKLGRGGVSYIGCLFNCSRNTILRGIQELGEKDILENRNREVGGGRRPVLEKHPDINDVFLQLIKGKYSDPVRQAKLVISDKVKVLVWEI